MKIRKPSGKAFFAWALADVFGSVMLLATADIFFFDDGAVPMPTKISLALLLIATVYTTVSALLGKRRKLAPIGAVILYLIAFSVYLEKSADGLTLLSGALGFDLLAAVWVAAYGMTYIYAGALRRLIAVE